MKKLFILILIIIVQLLSSCQKEDEFINLNPTYTKPLLKQINYFGGYFDSTYFYYEYNSDNKVKTEYLYNLKDGALLNKIEYQYDGNIIWAIESDFMQEGWTQIDTAKYERKNDELSILTRSNSDFLFKYYFSDNSCGHTILEVYNKTGSQNSTTTINYFDGNCSSISTAVYESSEWNNITITEFRDDKNNPLESITLDFYRSKDFGNVVTRQYTQSSGQTTYNFEYEFNASDYPTSMTVFRDGEVVGTASYNYY